VTDTDDDHERSLAILQPADLELVIPSSSLSISDISEAFAATTLRPAFQLVLG
jgi:hypothetical protein